MRTGLNGVPERVARWLYLWFPWSLLSVFPGGWLIFCCWAFCCSGDDFSGDPDSDEECDGNADAPASVGRRVSRVDRVAWESHSGVTEGQNNRWGSFGNRDKNSWVKGRGGRRTPESRLRPSRYRSVLNETLQR